LANGWHGRCAALRWLCGLGVGQHSRFMHCSRLFILFCFFAFFNFRIVYYFIVPKVNFSAA
jgi:hypothetical protein